MAEIVVVFDFDKTIVDCDSDNWLIDDLGATKVFDELLLTLPWNTAMDEMMGYFHREGKSMEEISKSLKTAPIHAKTISAIKSAYALGCDLKILSDANIFFIETMLKHHGLMGYFSEIISNPGYVDDEGKLRISPYHDFNTCSHGCSLCPPNMCKGAIIEDIRAAAICRGKKKFIYLGDGKGDYCPSLKLSEQDYVMPRKNFPLWELITSNANDLKAKVLEWGTFEELEAVLLSTIHNEISVTEIEEVSDQLIQTDCKFQTISVSGHDQVVSQAISVPH